MTLQVHELTEYFLMLFSCVRAHISESLPESMSINFSITAARSLASSLRNRKQDGLCEFHIVPSMSDCMTGSPHMDASAIAYENVSITEVDTPQHFVAYCYG